MAEASPAQIAAALSEYIYNRNAVDRPLMVKEKLGAEFVTSMAPTGLTQRGDFYYDYSNGFVGAVADVGGTRYVVFRGTDSSSDDIGGVRSATMDYLMGWTPGPSDGLDNLDMTKANLPLGFGTSDRTQLDSALALYKAAAGDGLKPVAVGQSLGGGLAALVAAVNKAPGYAFDAAPFTHSMSSVRSLSGRHRLP